MNIMLPSEKIYVAQSKMKNAGRGVFARGDIKKGELIEECPVIEIPEYETGNIIEGVLITYLYYFGTKKERSIIALGFGSIYNHTATPNATYKENPREKTISFIAIKNIKKDEEITVNYNQHEINDTPLWFEE